MGKGKMKKEKVKDTQKVPTKTSKRWQKQRRQQKFINKDRFWIQKCKNNKAPKDFPMSMILEIRITLVDLVDDHLHAGMKMQDAIQKTFTNLNQNVKVNSINEQDASETIQHVGEDEIKDIVEKGETPSEDQQPTFTEPFIKISKSLELIEAMKHPMHLPYIQNLPNGDCGDGIINPYPKEEVPNKFWAQRKRLFHKYDEGIQLDKESWYSVTPEVIANHIATRIANMKYKAEFNTSLIVLDPFCGVGGNAIALARNENISLVVCCDVDEDKLKCAAHNASIYGIESTKLIFVHGNALSVLKSYNNGKLSEVDVQNNTMNDASVEFKGYRMGNFSLLPKEIHVVFLSPPWGGLDYLQVGPLGFDVSQCIQVHDHESNIVADGEELMHMAANAASHKSIVYFLPKNIHGVNIGKCAFKVGYRKYIELEQNRLNGKLKTITVYLSDVTNGY